MLLLVPSGLNLKNFNVLPARCTCVLYMVPRLNTDFLPTQHSLLAWTDSGSECDFVADPSESLCRKERERTFWYINVSLDEKLKWSIIYHFYLLLIKQSVKCTIYLIPPPPKIWQTKLNYIFLPFRSGKSFMISEFKYDIRPWAVCVVSHCIFLKISNARIPHDRGAHVSAEPGCVQSVQ